MATITLDEYLEKIDELTANGSPDHAVNHGLYLLRQFPKCIAIYEKLGRAYMEMNRYGDSLNAYIRLCTACPENVMYHVSSAYILKECDQTDSAIFHTRTAIDLQPDNSDVHKDLLTWLNLDLSSVDFNDSATVAFSRGVLSFNEKKYKKAVLHFQEASAYPNKELLKQYLGLSLFYSGNIAEAMPILDEILAHSACNLNVLRAAAAGVIDLDKRKFARIIERLCELDPYYEHWELNGLELTPNRFPIRVSFFDWSGFPKMRVRVGWQQSSVQIVRNDPQVFPVWLDLLPADGAMLLKTDVQQPHPLFNRESFNRAAFFRDLSEQNSSQTPDREEIVQETPQRNELDDAFAYLEQFASGIETKEAAEELQPKHPAETVFPTLSKEETIPEPTENERQGMREAWRCFSTGESGNGVQYYKDLLSGGMDPRILKDDLEKLVILFPDSQELMDFYDEWQSRINQ